MALGPDSSDIPLEYRRLGLRLSNLFKGHNQRRFAPGEVLSETPDIDPKFRPRARMNSDNIDPALMIQFRSMGFSHAQEITAETHPELHAGWRELCRRAGFQKTLQLIVTDSKDPNAIDASESEVVMSTGLLKMLSFREILGVLGHELGHAQKDASSNRRIVIDAAATGTGALVGYQAGKRINESFYGPVEFAVNEANHLVPKQKMPHWAVRNLLDLGQFALMIGGGLIGMMIGHQFSVKPSELRADRAGIRLSGDPEALITAFKKMEAMSTHQPAWKKAFRYAKSGYPTFDARIRQIERIARENPPSEPPVYRMVEALSDLPPPPEVTKAKREQPGIPAARISNVTESERVIFVPKNTLLH